ncbi:competence protein CoiA [Candidatus Enterococcus courvalinii]|uniref:Competence protein CoiA n=1 Tax=Candidatus Enterococcus courvalinii TaxID=2815329 RepID=A0ABS3HXQ1_9ENTE|nr:competence protein CoiA family protein [Enterococcus sp. MSG2901]MBO0480840.1 competence protein CoiA [Enterococcus sp. MSG2901]
MLCANNRWGKRVIANDAEKQENYFCPACLLPVILKQGKQVRPHFAHKKSNLCQMFSEAESEEHIFLKGVFYQWLKKFNEKVEIEPYLPELAQRPDLLSENFAFEIQCSPLTYSRFIERTMNYQRKQFTVWWILGSGLINKKLLSGQKLSQLVKGSCRYDEQRNVHFWAVDRQAGKLYLYYGLTLSITREISCQVMEWSFYTCSLTEILTKKWSSGTQVIADRAKKSIHQELNRQLRWKKDSLLQVQEFCYMRGKHLLYLSSWIYQQSDFFFFFGTNVIVYRVLFDETVNENRVLHYLCWREELEKILSEWLFPLISKEQTYWRFFKECCDLWKKKEDN